MKLNVVWKMEEMYYAVNVAWQENVIREWKRRRTIYPLKMKKYEHWQIAYRKNGGEFILVPNPSWAWAADPFLVKYKGEIYLFAELFLYKSERNGVIGYTKFDGNGFGEWTVTMDRHWHISYPNVWVENGSLFMCPETHQTGEVAIYELVSFPDKWKKICVLLDNTECVDSTFLEYEQKKYLFTYRHIESRIKGELLLCCLDEKKNVNKRITITNDIGRARPGGNFLKRDERIIRVAQDCAKGYGAGLVFLEVEDVFPSYTEREITRIYPESIAGKWNKKFTGIHTYNVCENIEVIDLKYETRSWSEYVAQKRVRKVFVDKY